MPRSPKAPTPDLFNRDLSWVEFNARVQAQADDESLPLMDRVRFAAIVGSNLDEFFMVRVALARRNLRSRTVPYPDGLTPAKLLEALDKKIHTLFHHMHDNFLHSLRPALEKQGLRFITPEQYTPEDRAYLHDFFHENVLPILTPLAVDHSHPFPLLANGTVHLFLRVRRRVDENVVAYGDTQTVLVEMPRSMHRFIRLPAPRPGPVRIAWREDIVAAFAGVLMRGYDILGAYPFRILRDAELTVDEEQSENLLTAVEREIRRSRHGGPAVRLIVGHDTPQEIVAYLGKHCKLDEPDVVAAPGMLDIRALSDLENVFNRPDLHEPAWPPLPHPALPVGGGAEKGEKDIFSILREKDVLLSHPYQSFDPVVRFVEQAADDPDTLAIKITLYRVSGKSPLVRALIRAAENGKQVTALVELRARFDEEANIGWARRLDAAGAHVIYGVMGLKTHSKACIVVRREADGLRRYCHLGTGNYNDRTARQYTDLGYLTSRNAFGADLSSFFNVITGYSLPPVWQRIEMAPLGLRDRTQNLIRREIAKHTPETPGFIRAKMNSLVDPAIIRTLYEASRAGVRIDLLVRGMCALRPGVPGLSETIRVRSIVDKFLEHPRIFHYHNGGNEEVYASSADWMERNMDKRIELLFPILDPACRDEALVCLDEGFADNTNAWTLHPDGHYTRLAPQKGEAPRRSQRRLYERALHQVDTPRNTTPEGLFIAQTRPDEKQR